MSKKEKLNKIFQLLAEPRKRSKRGRKPSLFQPKKLWVQSRVLPTNEKYTKGREVSSFYQTRENYYYGGVKISTRTDSDGSVMSIEELTLLPGHKSASKQAMLRGKITKGEFWDLIDYINRNIMSPNSIVYSEHDEIFMDFKKEWVGSNSLKSILGQYSVEGRTVTEALKSMGPQKINQLYEEQMRKWDKQADRMLERYKRKYGENYQVQFAKYYQRLQKRINKEKEELKYYLGDRTKKYKV